MIRELDVDAIRKEVDDMHEAVTLAQCELRSASDKLTKVYFGLNRLHNKYFSKLCVAMYCKDEATTNRGFCKKHGMTCV